MSLFRRRKRGNAVLWSPVQSERRLYTELCTTHTIADAIHHDLRGFTQRFRLPQRTPNRNPSPKALAARNAAPSKDEQRAIDRVPAYADGREKTDEENYHQFAERVTKARKKETAPSQKTLEARQLVELRDRALNPPEWVESEDEPVPGYPRRPIPRDEDASSRSVR